MLLAVLMWLAAPAFVGLQSWVVHSGSQKSANTMLARTISAEAEKRQKLAIASVLHDASQDFLHSSANALFFFGLVSYKRHISANPLKR